MKLKAAFILTFIILSLFIVFPLCCVALAPRPADFAAVFASSVWRQAALNTALECVCSTALSVGVGYIFAYAVNKAEIPFKRFFGFVPLLHLMTPPFVGGLSFILLYGRQGFFTRTLLGLDVSLYGFPGLLIAQTLCFFPISYLICSEVLKGINPNIEQAARAMGASRAKIFFTVTLPLSLNGILSAALFISVSVLSDFGNPLIVAGRFKVLAVEIYTQLTGWVSAGKSCVLGFALLLPSVALFLLQNHFSKKRLSMLATVGSKESSLPGKKSSWLTVAFLTFFCAFVSFLVVAQFVSIVFGSVQKLWGVDTSLTFEHLKAMGRFLREIRNSVFFALLGAFFGTTLASLSAFFAGRTELAGKRYLDIVSQIPAAVPGSLFGLALSLAAQVLKIRASSVMIVIAMTIGFMPFSYRIMASVFGQIKTTLDDGARSLGADKLRTLNSILIPIGSGGIFSSFVYDFVRGVGTVSAVIFLVSFKTPLASIKILNLAEQGDWGDSAALALVLTVITFLVLAMARLIGRKFFGGGNRNFR